MSEFSLIDRYFTHIGEASSCVNLGIGDDAAIVEIGGQLQCIAVDTLISGIHFPEQTNAFDVGYKSLAVNLSDMAAMGARPQWATLAISLSDAQDEQWIADFAAGMNELAQQFAVKLIGGDTTRGPCLTISVQIAGVLEDDKALRRDAAQLGDAIFVSGSIGDAAIGLKRVSTAEESDYFVQRLNRPTPRVNEALLLKPFIRAAIDVSDGLLADLGHILARSRVGARLDIENVPFGPGVREAGLGDSDYCELLSGGDDYELCFTVAEDDVDAMLARARENGIAVSRIGSIVADAGLRCFYEDGRELTVSKRGYDHFAEGDA